MSTSVMATQSLYDFRELLLQQGVGARKGVHWGSVDELGDQHDAVSRRASQPPSVASLVTSLLLDNLNAQHRRLERTQSEPSKGSATALQVVNTSRYKTELCRPFEESGSCKYGDKCQFAHGVHELRNLVRHPKYKTELCRTFHTVGFCPYGPRCHFIHNAEEARAAMLKSRRLLALPPGSAPDTPSPPSSLGSVSPPPAFAYPLLTPPQSPPPPPDSPDARLPVFNRLSINAGPLVHFTLRFGGELLA